MMGDGYYGGPLRALGATVHTLRMPKGRITLSGFLKLKRLIIQTAPDVVQTWMYHADLVGGIAARWGGVRAVLWGIRNSNLHPQKSSLSSRTAARLSSWLSSWIPSAIISCSARAASLHQALGYRADKFAVIPNGYDTSRFSPNAHTRIRLRTEWQIADQEVLFGMVARWDPQKDHENLLRALSKLQATGLRFRCALVGEGMDRRNDAIATLIDEFRLRDSVILAGPRDDIPAVMNALDVHILCSAFGEGFPNVVAEAMACGTPCIATDVGDASIIVGSTGWVIEPRNVDALAAAMTDATAQISGKDRALLSKQCQVRIEEHYKIEKMAAAFAMVWKSACEKRRS
jgi:glycosyltransferase involved in cell wall biosynthesis